MIGTPVSRQTVCGTRELLVGWPARVGSGLLTEALMTPLLYREWLGLLAGQRQPTPFAGWRLETKGRIIERQAIQG